MNSPETTARFPTMSPGQSTTNDHLLSGRAFAVLMAVSIVIGVIALLT